MTLKAIFYFQEKGDAVNMNKIIIISSTKNATGGTELLQQLCYKLRLFGQSAYMYYVGDFDKSPLKNKFSFYKNPAIETLEDEKDNIVVVPETMTEYLKAIHNANCYLWWLSVDNYFGALKHNPDLLHKVFYKIKDLQNNFIFGKCVHLVQSEYAKLYLEERNITNVQYLSDYLNESYLQKASENGCKERDNVILFNPKKGYEFTKKLIQEVPEYKWVALENLSVNQMIDVMHSSKLYVDFGNHPGKDRIPREAAICGCCVITGVRGAAANNQDIMIDDEYKFEDSDSNIVKIHEKIANIMNDFDLHTRKFQSYRDRIKNEEKVFDSDVKKIFCSNENLRNEDE